MKKIFPILIVVSMIFLSIGYASISSINLNITGDLSIFSQNGVFITEINYVSSVDADINNSKIINFSNTLLNSKIVLSDTNGNSSITYQITIYNKNDEPYKYTTTIFDESFYDNENIVFTLNGINKNEIIEPKSTKTFNISFHYKDNTVSTNNILNSVVSFKYRINETAMEEVLVDNFVPSGNIEDVEEINIDEMTTEERKNKFSNIASGKEIHTIDGLTGETVIILRGNYDNNYVSFAGFTWRILQIDANGNLKIILDGVLDNTTSKYRDSASATSLDSAMELLKYQNSNIKTILDTWYQTNLNNYQDKIVTTKFCNNFTNYQRTSSGTNANVYYYQSYENLGQDSNNYSPYLLCPSEYIFEDNIGLISAEEVVLAGGAYMKVNTSYFLYNSTITNYYWTLSPAYFDNNQNNANVFVVAGNVSGVQGQITDWTKNLVTNSYLVRPVITINGSFPMNGNGTITNPFVYQ